MKKFTIFTIAFMVMAQIAQAAPQFINIGTAGIGGGYYPTGGFICNAVNKSRKKLKHNIRCSVESTPGSVANLRSLQSGDLAVGIAMATWQMQSWEGIGRFKEDGKNKKLRFLFSVVEEPSQLVARKDTNIKRFMDLKNKVVNTGSAGSGVEAQVYSMLERYGLKAKSFFKQETKLNSREQAKALCDGKIDAFFYVGAAGNATITEASNTCEVDVVNWNDSLIKDMLSKRTDAYEIVIPKGTYKGQNNDVSTWGMPGSVLATADVPEDVIYNLVKSVFDSFESFKSQSPMYKTLTKENAATKGRSAPYHPGALKYFKEVGLVK